VSGSLVEGRADLVVWGEARIHLLDFKHSKAFGEGELASYRTSCSGTPQCWLYGRACP